jgi:hypothetical protein
MKKLLLILMLTGMCAAQQPIQGLPPGLSLDPKTGVISGTPTKAGVYQFTVEVLDADNPNQKASKTFLFTIAATTLTITSNSIPSGRVGESFSYTFAASGGVPAYTWSVTTTTAAAPAQ